MWTTFQLVGECRLRRLLQAGCDTQEGQGCGVCNQQPVQWPCSFRTHLHSGFTQLTTHAGQPCLPSLPSCAQRKNEASKRGEDVGPGSIEARTEGSERPGWGR